MSTYALKAKNLSKDFWIKKSLFAKKKNINAVKDCNFEIKKGDSVAFLGPNGAGKSTTIKLLCGILKPTQGNSWIAGHESGSLGARKCLGLIFGTRSNLWMYLNVKHSLEMLGAIYGLSNKEIENRIQSLSELFEISNFLDTPPNTLSLGERMRCEIVASLIPKPSVLLADEPTIGLDVVGKAKFRNLLKQWQEEEKTTLLLTSHDINDVEVLCQQAILINHGSICYNGSLKGLKGNFEWTRNIKLTLATPVDDGISWRNQEIKTLDNLPLIKKFQIDIRKISSTTAIDRFMNHYKDNILDISVEEIGLESIITQWYEEGKT
jgi:ABC-2 type transport system ATP-binding protein